MSFYGWKPYVSVAERRMKAEKAAAKAQKSGKGLSPVKASRGAIAKTFWGKAWCDNLERYSDYANRLPRGRTYVRNGSVIDLNITAGQVHAQVVGSRLYKTVVKVAAVPAKQWQSVSTSCAGSIGSLVELLQGRLSKSVMERICAPDTGLFPAPEDIQFGCSCPDWASMCKHVAAVLYGVGARLDEQPELIFTLRCVDAKDLVAQAGAGLPQSKRAPASNKVLDDAALADVFGIEMVDPAAAKKPGAARRKPSAGDTVESSLKPARISARKVAKAAEPETSINATTKRKPPQVKAITKAPTKPRAPTTGKAATITHATKKPAPSKPTPNVGPGGRVVSGKVSTGKASVGKATTNKVKTVR